MPDAIETMNIDEIRRISDSVLNTVRSQMRGIDDIIRLCLIALYANGHILLEGNPGLGKTELVKSLSTTLKFPYGRIQFTPDLMPSDITGTEMPDQNRNLKFKPGPVFTSLMLADEINRATPKTQAAMLEAMAEKQVTVLGKRYAIDQRNFVEDRDNNGNLIEDNHSEHIESLREGQRGRPFIVLATQNPIDQEGTYDLPEAQADRFMFKILMPMPGRETMGEIILKTTQSNGKTASREPIRWAEATSIRAFQGIIEAIRQVKLDEVVEEHIYNIYLASNKQWDEIRQFQKKWSPIMEHLEGNPAMMDRLEYGLGPRAVQAMVLGTKAHALLFPSNPAQHPGQVVANVSSLAKIVIPVLRHRLKLRFNWHISLPAGWAIGNEALSATALTREKNEARRKDYFLAALCSQCIPTNANPRSYKEPFNAAMTTIVTQQRY